MKPILTPRELAEAIGVSESSLKRWADEGLVRVSRTAGGHRRIPIAEAVRFIRESRSPLVRPEILGLGEIAIASGDRKNGMAPSEQLLSYLSEGRAAEARGLLLSLYISGSTIAAISDGPVRTAMERLGEIWTRDERGIFIEHRAADICMSAFAQLHTTLGIPDNAPVAVGGAPSHDPGVLSSLVASTVLASEGLRAVNLGAFTPLMSIRHAVESQRAVIAWLSFTHPVESSDSRQGIVDLARDLAKLNCRLAIGGHQHAALGVTSGGNIFVGESMSELAAFARGVVTALTPEPDSAGSAA